MDLNQNKRQNVSFNCCTIQPVFVSCLMSLKPESSPESSFELFTAQSYFISSILLMLCDASVPHFFVCIFGDTSSQFDSSQTLQFRFSLYALRRFGLEDCHARWGCTFLRMQVAWETLLVAQERSFGGQRNSAARFRASLPPSLYLGQPSLHLFSNPLILQQQLTKDCCFPN